MNQGLERGASGAGGGRWSPLNSDESMSMLVLVMGKASTPRSYQSRVMLAVTAVVD